MSLSTMHLFSQKLEEAAAAARQPTPPAQLAHADCFGDDSTDTDGTGRDVKLERKLASIRLSTRHLRAKLLAECDELERARISATSLHQYLHPQQPELSPPQPPTLPAYPTQMANPYLAYQMSLASWLAYTNQRNNLCIAMQNMNYAPWPQQANPYQYPYYNAYHYETPTSTPTYATYCQSPYAMPIICETYNHFAKVNQLCKEESEKIEEFKKNVRRVHGDTGMHSEITNDEEQNNCTRRKKHKRHRHHRHSHEHELH